jgi:hypothetical protein
MPQQESDLFNALYRQSVFTANSNWWSGDMVENASMILVGDVFEEHKVRFLLRQCNLIVHTFLTWLVARGFFDQLSRQAMSACLS